VHNIQIESEVREATPLLEVGKYLAIHRAEPPVGTESRLLRQQNIHVIVFGDLIGSLERKVLADGVPTAPLEI
jgi:hypothetical protein